MNRRSFLRLAAGAAAAFALDPERALWVPGAKLISIPRPRIGAIEILPPRQLFMRIGLEGHPFGPAALYTIEQLAQAYSLPIQPLARKVGDIVRLRQPARFEPAPLVIPPYYPLATVDQWIRMQ